MKIGIKKLENSGNFYKYEFGPDYEESQNCEAVEVYVLCNTYKQDLTITEGIAKGRRAELLEDKELNLKIIKDNQKNDENNLILLPGIWCFNNSTNILEDLDYIEVLIEDIELK